MSLTNKVDVAILVPKEDELRAVEWAFESNFAKSDGKLIGGKGYYLLNLNNEISGRKSTFVIAVVFVNDQGNSMASNITEQVLLQLDPTILVLTGTAAGRQGKVAIGGVVASSLVIDAQEWRIEDSNATPRARQHEPPEDIRTDIERFIGKNNVLQEWYSRLLQLPDEVVGEQGIVAELWPQRPVARMGLIGSSNYLHLNLNYLDRLWGLDDRLCCVDMESAGFGSACRGLIQKQWLIVRGISDIATLESKKASYRVASAASAALLLRMFLEKGLVEGHPNWLRVPEAEKTELSSDNFYSQVSIKANLVKGLREKLGVDLADIDLGRSLLLSDFESLCVARGAERKSVQGVLAEIREKSFTTKYRNYSYDNDLRGLLPNWTEEISKILDSFSIDLKASVVLNVGAGNGLEIHALFEDAQEVIAVDISQAMLDEAKLHNPSIRTICNPAEDMEDVNTESIDLYISLRTYQSSLFDMAAGLREAQRVLKRHGLLVISIANGFVDLENGETFLDSV
jgi:nucleoside phosphorylase